VTGSVSFGKLLRSLTVHGQGGGASNVPLPPPPPASAGWQPSPLAAGGFTNVVSQSPTHPLVWLCGGDVWGIAKSVDGMLTWANKNASFDSSVHYRACAITWHPTIPGRCFLLTGNGSSGAVWESTDFGETWANRSSTTATIRGAGNNQPQLTPDHDHPRSTGNLIQILDAGAGSMIFVATFDQGVYRAPLPAVSGGPFVWTRIGLAPTGGNSFYCRSTVYDPATDTLLVSTFENSGVSNTAPALVCAGNGKVYRFAAASTGNTATELVNSPVNVEEMILRNGTVFALAHNHSGVFPGAAGMFRFATPATSVAAWLRLTGLPVVDGNGPYWIGLDGYRTAAGVMVLWCGAYLPDQVAGTYYTTYRAVDASGNDFATAGAGVWAQHPAAFDAGGLVGDVRSKMGGPAGTHGAWWAWLNTGLMFGKAAGVGACIAIDKSGVDFTNAGKVAIAGRAGVWGTLDDGATFYPFVWGILANIVRPTIADPQNNSRFYVGLGDNVFGYTADLWQTFVRAPAPGGGTGYSVATDSASAPTVVFVGKANDYANSGGEIWRNDDVTNASAWVKELDNAQAELGADAGKRPVGLIVTRDAGNNRVIIAALEESGIWTKTGAAAWVQSASTTPGAGLALMTNQATQNADMTCTPGNPFVYCYDRNSGLWRGSDYGRGTWVRIWDGKATPAGGVPGDSESTGYCAMHPTDPTIIYSANTNGVFKITGCSTVAAGGVLSTAGNLIAIGGAQITARWGPLQTGFDGYLYLLERSVGGSIAKQWRSTQTIAADPNITSWLALDDTISHNTMQMPFDIAVNQNGDLASAQNGNGVTIRLRAA
jgi:hypothetical protein